MIKFLNFKKKSKNKYLLIIILFFLVLICYNFRFEIIYNISTTFGYDENKARRYSFIFSEKPFQISLKKLRNLFNPLWLKKEEFNIAVKVKKNFTDYNSSKLDFKDGNYFLNIFTSIKKKILTKIKN